MLLRSLVNIALDMARTELCNKENCIRGVLEACCDKAEVVAAIEYAALTEEKKVRWAGVAEARSQR